MTETKTSDTLHDILEAARQLEIDKKNHIEALLKERHDLAASTEDRLKSIKAELAALGHKVERKRKAAGK